MSEEKSLEMIIVLDRSGSMSSIMNDMCGGFDQFIADQRKLPGRCNVTLVQFNGEYEECYTAIPIADVGPLVLNPMGSTALLDALARAITDAGRRFAAMEPADRPQQVKVIIITDGEENASKEYKGRYADIANMIEHQREVYSWDFVYMGTNQDALKVAASINIPLQASVTYENTGRGSRAVMAGLNASVTRSRVLGAPVAYDHTAYAASLDAVKP